MKYIKSAFSIVALAIVAYIGMTAYSWNSSTNEIASVCTQAQTNTDFGAIKSAVASSENLKLNGPIERDGKISYLIHSPKSMGRAVCSFEVAKDKVLNAVYAQ